MKGDVKPGYKMTEVGEIPEDWEVVPLGQLGAWKGGGTPSMQNPAFWRDGSIPWVSSGDVKHHLLFNTPMKITSDAVKNSSTTLLPVNSIVIVTRSGILRKYLPVAMTMAPLAINQDIKAIIPTADKSPGYFLQTLQWSGDRILATCMKSGTTVESVETRWLKSFSIPLPPTKAEQTAIATALSDVDALIESLEQLIAKKRNIKQGAMQEFLTGKRRLPGFSGEWEEKRFAEIAHPRNERIDPRTTYAQEFCIELEHIGQGTGSLTGHTVTSDNSSLKTIFKKDDVLFGKLRAYLRKYWIANCDGVCSTEIWAFTANHRVVIPKYLFQIVKLDCFVEAASSAYGTHMPRSDWQVLKNYEIFLPPIDEQEAISDILTGMDIELSTLGTKLSKTRHLKQAMMQELLTGRIRLV